MSKLLKFLIPIVTGLMLVLGFAAPASAATTLLPTPTGQYKIGERTLFLVDSTRSNRQVEAQVWYPTTATSGTLARYLSQNTTNDQTLAVALTNGFEGRSCYAFFGSVSCMGSTPLANTLYPRIDRRDTHAFVNAAVRTDLGKLPTVVLSPGFGVPSYHYSAIAEDLASNGYIVVATSITNESIANEVSNGVANQNVSGANQTTFNTRIADYRFVMNKLSTLPNGIGTQIDMNRIGGGGHSWGGYTSMEAAYNDARIIALANIDGTPGWTANTAATNNAMNNGLQKPVLRLQGGNSDINGVQSTTWGTYNSKPHGALYQLSFANTGHYYFSDLCYIGYPAHQADAPYCGTTSTQLTMDSVRAYILAFFDKHLKGQPGPLLDGPSAQYPNVTFMQ